MIVAQRKLSHFRARLVWLGNKRKQSPLARKQGIDQAAPRQAVRLTCFLCLVRESEGLSIRLGSPHIKLTINFAHVVPSQPHVSKKTRIQMLKISLRAKPEGSEARSSAPGNQTNITLGISTNVTSDT